MSEELSDFAAELYDMRKLRLGKEAGEVHDILTLPGKQVWVVPLADFELGLVFERVASMKIDDSTSDGLVARHRALERETLVFALKHVDDIAKPAFKNSKELQKVLETPDVNYLYEQYVLMVDKSSPSIEGFTNEQIELLKKGLERLNWNGLYGKQWMLLKAFLFSLTPEQLMDNFSGFSSMFSSTPTSTKENTATSAEKNTSTTDVLDAEKSQVAPVRKIQSV